MSLICDESGRFIMYGDPLRVGTRSDDDFFYALSSEVLDRIPESERRAEPCVPEEGGVDIHNAISDRNFTGAYTVTVGFKKLKFLFSISQAALERYLPKHAKRYKRD